MKLRLRFLNGELRGKTLDMDEGKKCVIGRNSESTVQLTDALVSKKHAIITCKDGCLFIEDLDSRNGTFVNSVQVNKTILHQHDCIGMGMHIILVEASEKIKDDMLLDKTVSEAHISLQEKQISGEHPELRECVLGLEAIVDDYSDMMVKASLKMIFKVLPVDRLSIFAVRDNNQISQGYTITRQAGLTNEHMSKSFVSRVLKVNDAVIFRDAQELPADQWGTTIVRQNICAIMGVPISLRGKSVAVLLADNLQKPDALEDKHLKLLKFVAKAIEVIYQRDVVYKLDNLGSFLPICAYCKKIRDDQGYWNQIESFISKRADVSFSHGYCPECAKEVLDNLESGEQV